MCACGSHAIIRPTNASLRVCRYICESVVYAYIVYVNITNYKSVTTKNFPNGKVENGFSDASQCQGSADDGAGAGGVRKVGWCECGCGCVCVCLSERRRAVQRRVAHCQHEECVCCTCNINRAANVRAFTELKSIELFGITLLCGLHAFRSAR